MSHMRIDDYIFKPQKLIHIQDERILELKSFRLLKFSVCFLQS